MSKILLFHDIHLNINKTLLGRLWFIPLFLKIYNIDAITHPPKLSLAHYYLLLHGRKQRKISNLDPYFLDYSFQSNVSINSQNTSENDDVIFVNNYFKEFSYPFLFVNYEKILQQTWEPPKNVIWVLTMESEINAKISQIEIIKKYIDHFNQLFIITDNLYLRSRNNSLSRYFKDEYAIITYDLQRFFETILKKAFLKDYLYDLDVIDFLNLWNEKMIEFHLNSQTNNNLDIYNTFTSSNISVIRKMLGYLIKNRITLSKQKLNYFGSTIDEEFFTEIAVLQNKDDNFSHDISKLAISPFIRNKQIAYQLADILATEVFTI